MLVILDGTPGTAPGEAAGAEQLVAEIVFVDLVREILRAVREGGGAGRTDPGRTDVGILEGISKGLMSTARPSACLESSRMPVFRR